MNIGIIGCGNISNAYFEGAKVFPGLDIVACADIVPAIAESKAAEHGIKASSVTELLDDPGVELVINLTIPRAHASVSLAALTAGKHVHSEKPLGVDLEEARRLVAMAQAEGRRLSCAPDTFLGAGQQTVRKLIDDGWIGEVRSGTAFMMSPGPERWHPNPSIFYDEGAGPMLDMGPYYVTALVNLLGPVVRVLAMTTQAQAERIAVQQDHARFPVRVPTHYTGILTFASGAVITLCMSFDVQRHRHRPIELYGERGTVLVPDPNTFDNPVRLFVTGNEDFNECAFSHPTGYRRAAGVADLVAAIAADRPHRCSGDLALHALEVMLAFEKSADLAAPVDLTTRCERPDALPPEGLASV